MTNDQIEKLSNENVDLKRKIKDLEAQIASLDSTSMDFVRSNHQIKTQLVLSNGMIEDYKNTLAIMTKQYMDEQNKVDKLSTELNELKALR